MEHPTAEDVASVIREAIGRTLVNMGPPQVVSRAVRGANIFAAAKDYRSLPVHIVVPRLGVQFATVFPLSFGQARRPGLRNLMLGTPGKISVRATGSRPADPAVLRQYGNLVHAVVSAVPGVYNRAPRSVVVAAR